MLFVLLLSICEIVSYFLSMPLKYYCLKYILLWDLHMPVTLLNRIPLVLLKNWFLFSHETNIICCRIKLQQVLLNNMEIILGTHTRIPICRPSLRNIIFNLPVLAHVRWQYSMFFPCIFILNLFHCITKW